MPTLSGSITGHSGTIRFTVTFQTVQPDAATAQTTLNAIKAFFTNGGATIESVSANFVPDTTALS